MEERLTLVEDQLVSLQATVSRLEQRLARLEAGSDTADHASAEDRAAEAVPDGAGDAVPSWGLRAVSLAGRSLLVFAGAYLLRALTDSGTLPAAAGVGVGLAYAGVWLAAAARARDALGAAFHGGSATLVAFPLIVEATLRFALFTPAAAAVVLGAAASAFGTTAWWTRQRPLAWMATTAATVAGIVIAVRGDATAPFAVLFVLIGIGTLWLGYDREWTILRWPAAAVANIFVLGVTARAVNPEIGQSPWTALGVQFLLLGGYLSSIAVRTIVRGRGVIPFEVVQTVAALGVGLGGAIAVTRALDTGTTTLGAAACAMGAATYAVAFLWVERRGTGVENFLFYTSLALVLTLAGLNVLFDGAALAMSWAGLGVGAAALGGRLSRMTLFSHAAAYLAGAAVAAGLLTHTLQAMAGESAGLLGWLPWPALVVAFAAAACAVIRVDGQPELPWTLRQIPRLALIVIGALGAASIGVDALAWASGSTGTGTGMGVLATERTAVLSLLALAAAWATRWPRLSSGGVLVYPVLLLTGLRLVVEDLRHSTPSTLFVAFAFYGAALILAPRLRRVGAR